MSLSRRLWWLVVPALAACPIPGPQEDGGPSDAGPTQTGCTDIVLPLDGQDVGWRVGLGLTAYNGWAWVPQFGPAHEADYSVSGANITVNFHPKRKYTSDQNRSFDNKYWLYVGLMSPFVVSTGFCHLPGKRPGERAWNRALPRDGGPAGPLRFRGRLRINHHQGIDQYWMARTLAIGGVYGFYPKDHSSERIVAFNNAGYESVALADTTKYDCRGQWNNLYWGTWWSDTLFAQPSGWGPWVDFDVDLEEAARKASALAAACGKPLASDEVALFTAHVGPEDFVGASLTFEVADLRLESK